MKLSVQITRGIESLFGTRDENIRVLESGLKVTASLPVGKSPHGVFILKAPAATPLRAASTEPDPK